MATKYGVGDGWNSIIDTMLLLLKEIDPNTTVHIKEKYGSLCVYTTNQDYQYNQEIEEIIEMAQTESSSICEHCGKPGSMDCFQGWEKTLCDGCKEARHDGRLKRIGQSTDL